MSIYCRHEGAILLVMHTRLGVWLPIGGELERGESPLEAAYRELVEETGYEGVTFPLIHKVIGAPPGLILYEEHDAGSKGTHMNFAFVAEVPTKVIPMPNKEFTEVKWVDSLEAAPPDCPANVRQTLMYTLTAGREQIIARA